MLNIKKTLTKLMPTVGTNYIIFCGIGVAWGTFTSQGAWAYTITYGITFSENPIVLASKAENASTVSSFASLSKSTTKTTINFTSTANAKTVDWLAIGKV